MRHLTRRQAAMVEQHIHIVEPIARRVHATLPQSIELDDLVQAGCIGLAQAAQRYDRDRGLPFGTYARYRVRGAIIDSCNRRNYRYELHLSLEDHAQAVSDPHPAPDAIAHSRSLAPILELALRALPACERRAIKMRAEGASYEEIASTARRSMTWAYYCVAAARRKLQRELAMRGIGRDAA